MAGARKGPRSSTCRAIGRTLAPRPAAAPTSSRSRSRAGGGARHARS